MVPIAYTARARPPTDDGDGAVRASRLHRRSRPERTPMDGFRFDALARSLTAAGSRRRALSAANVGVLSPLALGTTDAKKKKRCGPCKKRKHGKCKPKPNGTACSGGS